MYPYETRDVLDSLRRFAAVQPLEQDRVAVKHRVHDAVLHAHENHREADPGILAQAAFNLRIDADDFPGACINQRTAA